VEVKEMRPRIRFPLGKGIRSFPQKLGRTMQKKIHFESGKGSVDEYR